MKWPFARPSRKAASSADLFRELAGGAVSKSGVRVTQDTVLEAGVAMACARVIAEGLAQVPCRLMELIGDTRRAAVDHASFAKLASRPNPRMTSYEFFESMGLHLVLAGNFYAFKTVVGGAVRELIPIVPSAVTVKRDKALQDPVYEVRIDNTTLTLGPEQIWHVRGPSWNGWMGLEGVRMAREAIGLSMAAEEHTSRSFSNGAALGGILSTDSVLKQDQVDALRTQWEKTYGGVENAFKTAILWGGLKWHPRAQQNDQAQLVEQRRFQVEEVCRAFRVLPIMIGYSDKTATYASAEQMFLAHVVHTLGPWYRRVEQSIEANLLSEADRKRGIYVKFVVQGLLRGAAKDRAEYFTKALGAGGSPAWMTQDEVRALEDLNPMGGAAAVLPVATNVTPAPDTDTGGDDDGAP